MNASDCVRSLVPALLLLGAAHAQEPTVELRSQVYDVRDLVRIESEFLSSTAMEASFAPAPCDVDAESASAVGLSDLVALVWACTSPATWDREGFELHAEDAGFLTANCDDKMHGALRSVLAQLRQLMFEPVLVEVHELPGSVLVGRRAVLSADEADALLAGAGEHRVHFGRANVRKPLLLESNRTQNTVAGLRIKVANDAAAPDLITEPVVYGASWTLQVRRTVGGVVLLHVSGSDRQREPVPANRDVSTGEGSISLELPTARIATCEASAYLDEGQALLVGTNANAGTVLCVFVRLSDQAGGCPVGEVTAYPIAALVNGSAEGVNVRVPYQDVSLFEEREAEPRPAVFDEGRLMEWLTSEVAPDTWDGAPNTLNVLDGYLFVRADAAVQRGVAEKLQSLLAIDRRQYSLEVRFGEVASGAISASGADLEQLAESLPQRCLSSVSGSRGTRLSATRHIPYVDDYDAVVASSKGVTEPVIRSFAQGFVLRGMVAPMDERAVMLDLDLTMLSNDGIRASFDLQNPHFGPVDKADVRENKVRGASRVEVGAWTLLHLSPVEGSTSHVVVVARVGAL